MPAIPVQSLPVSLFGAPESSFALATTGLSQTGASASAVTGALSAAAAQPLAGSSASGPHAPFADLLTEAVGRVEQYESQAKSAIEGMMTGQGVDVHQAMIATEKAESGFELVLAVRNKALAAYQQVVGMQF